MVCEIGQVAERLGVHPETLRRWERKGLIDKAHKNPLTGRRKYSEEDIRVIEALIKERKE